MRCIPWLEPLRETVVFVAHKCREFISHNPFWREHANTI